MVGAIGWFVRDTFSDLQTQVMAEQDVGWAGFSGNARFRARRGCTVSTRRFMGPTDSKRTFAAPVRAIARVSWRALPDAAVPRIGRSSACAVELAHSAFGSESTLSA